MEQGEGGQGSRKRRGPRQGDQAWPRIPERPQSGRTVGGQGASPQKLDPQQRVTTKEVEGVWEMFAKGMVREPRTKGKSMSFLLLL